MKNIISLIICITWMILPYASNAQSTYKIEGKVIFMETQDVDNNSENEVFEGVNIILLRNDSSFIKGSLSNKKGNFQFTDVAKGDYLLKFSYVGYETILIALKDISKNIKLKDIQLHKNITELAEVTVQGNPIIRKVDRMIVYPTEASLKHSYDPYDVIAGMMIPRLRANRITKTLETDGGEIQIRINGIKATREELQAIPAREIIRIDVIDNPGMKYGDETLGAVVDVIVKRRTTGGLVNLGGTVCPYQFYANYNLGTKLNYKRSQWGFFYNCGLRDTKEAKQNTDETFNLGENNIVHRIQEGLDGRIKNKLHNIGIIYNYSHPDNYMINVAFRNRIWNSPHNDYFSKLYSVGNNENEYIFNERKGDEQFYTPSLDILFEKKFKKEQTLQLNVIGTSIRTTTNSLYREHKNNAEVDLTYIQNYAESNKQSIWGEALYDKTFKNIILSTGVRHYQTYVHAQYKGTDPTTSSMHQINSSVFFDLQGRIKAFSYLVSLGGMRTSFKERDKKNTYYLFTPSARVSLVPHKDGWMQYRFNSSSTVPSLGYLTDVQQQVDSIQIRRGNPYLKAYRTYNNSLMYSFNKPKFAYVVELYYSYSDKPVMEEYMVENQKLIRTVKNQKYLQTFSVNTTWMFRNIKLGEITLGANLYLNFNRFWSKGYTYNHTYSYFYARGNIDVGYKKFLLSTSYWKNYETLSGETIIKGENGIQCELIYTHKKLQVTAAVINPFVNKYKFGSTRISSIAPNIIEHRVKDTINRVLIGVRYNFEFGKKFKDRDKKARYNDTDSGILDE